MFAQAFLDLGLTEGVLTLVRIIASIGGAVVGWFLCDPLTRLLYRLIFRAPTPGWLLPWAKIFGAISLGLAIYFFMPLGGGGNGWGLGSGFGGNAGKGPGNGGETASKANDIKANPEKQIPTTNTQLYDRHSVEVEILGGKRFEDDGKLRYYLLNRAGVPLSLAQMEDYFKEHQSKILIKIVQTDESVVFNSEEDPTRLLRKLASRYDIPTQGPKE